MSGAIDNGRRAQVTFGAFSGLAGIEELPGGAMRIAFAADFRRLRGVKEGTVDGAAVRVESVDRSRVPGMVAIVARRAEDDV